MRGLFIAGTKTNRRDSGFASPVNAVRGEVPFAAWGRGQADLFTRGLSCLNEWVILLQRPCREIFIHRKNEASIGWLVVKEFFQFDRIFIFIRNQRLDLCPDLLL